MPIPLKPPRPGNWSVLAAVAAVVICSAVPAKAVEPEWSYELEDLTEITKIWLEDKAKDGCWPSPKVTENLVIARLKASGLSFGVTPRPERPERPKRDDPDYETKAKEWEETRGAILTWDNHQLWIYVHAFDLGLESGGRPLPVCIA